MSSNNNLMLLIASAMPEEMIIEQLEEAITQHKILKTKDTGDKVGMYCAMFMSKQMTEKDGVEKIMKESDEIFRIKERLNSDKQ